VLPKLNGEVPIGNGSAVEPVPPTPVDKSGTGAHGKQGNTSVNGQWQQQGGPRKKNRKRTKSGPNMKTSTTGPSATNGDVKTKAEVLPVNEMERKGG
jgi:hypothetical protein